ncbi:MAG TPA: metallophosphoesterase [Gemmatimonadales bacterium]|nr:metallophosphoesterase [Gemmatimonadales bacterium]
MSRSRMLVAALLVAAAARAAPILPSSPAWVEIPLEELRGGYDTLWAVSDVHGRLKELHQLLLVSGLAVADGESLRWNPRMARQLLVVDGDMIDGGKESVGTVLLIEALQDEAARAGSRVVVLLGNHEAEFLANPRSASHELRASVRRPSANMSTERMSGEELCETRFGKYLRRLPIAAVIGTWLVAHSGYIRADDAADARAYFDRLDAAIAKGDYGPLLERSSILESHNWWASRGKRKHVRKVLRQLGLNGLVFGHDPDALRADGMLAVDADGWMTKLDTGLKLRHSRGMLLRCDVAAIARGAELVMMDGASSTCRALAPDGSLSPLPVK